MPAREISAGEGRDDRTVLKQEGLNQGRQNAVGVGPGLGTIVKRTVAKNHVRPNGIGDVAFIVLIVRDTIPPLTLLGIAQCMLIRSSGRIWMFRLAEMDGRLN